MDKGLKPKVDIYELMKNLNMKNSEIDDVFLGRGEVNTMKQNLRSMAVTKVHKVKMFGLNSLCNTMTCVWGLACEFSFRVVEVDMFVLQMSTMDLSSGWSYKCTLLMDPCNHLVSS